MDLDAHSDPADLGEEVLGLGRLGELVQARVELLAARRDVAGDVLGAEDVLRRDTRRARHGVSGVRPAERSGVELVRDRLVGDDARDGEAVGDALGEDHDVGSEALGVLGGKVRAGPEEARLHLVDDEHDAVLVAHLAEVVQEGRGARYVSAARQHSVNVRFKRLRLTPRPAQAR